MRPQFTNPTVAGVVGRRPTIRGGSTCGFTPFRFLKSQLSPAYKVSPHATGFSHHPAWDFSASYVAEAAVRLVGELPQAVAQS